MLDLIETERRLRDAIARSDRHRTENENNAALNSLLFDVSTLADELADERRNQDRERHQDAAVFGAIQRGDVRAVADLLRAEGV